MNGLGFLVTVSRKIKFMMAEFVPQRTKGILGRLIKNLVNFYATYGFNVKTDLMDMEFDKLKGEITGVDLQTTAMGEHQPDIE